MRPSVPCPQKDQQSNGFQENQLHPLVSQAFWDDDDEADPSKNLLVRCVARHLPLHDKYSEEPRFFVRVKVEGLESAAEPPREGAKIIGKSKDEVELWLGCFFESRSIMKFLFCGMFWGVSCAKPEAIYGIP